ncbi:MAG TPA: DUF4129 domain-containing protein [Candidatus Limnocylindrales bacterium]|nr:DUF4129 domain-containing protein [Candidatus Limnocylindrales bacterium]
MRSNWSAEALLAVLAAASLEGAGLTLGYLAIDWLSGNRTIHFGVQAFAVAVVIGFVVARRHRQSSWTRYLITVPGTTVLVGVVGGWAVLTSGGAAADPVALLANSGPWLLGVGVLRGTAHAELDDEALTAEGVLRIGLPGILAFWLLAAASDLTRDPAYTTAAFGTTLTFVSSGLLSIGLARLKELEVDAIDRAARRRWLALLFGVSGSLLIVGIPLAGLLQIPVATAIAGAAGPLATLLVVAFAVLAAPILFVAERLIHLIGPIELRFNLPEIQLPGGRSSTADGDLTALILIVGVLIAVEIVVILVIVAAILRRRRRRSRARGEEVREGEPINLGALLRLPRFTLRRPGARTPGDAVEAYRFALAALARRDEGRRPGETPREHASRIRATLVGPSVARLAVDYELRALAGRRLTPAEERRARERWRRVSHWAR